MICGVHGKSNQINLDATRETLRGHEVRYGYFRGSALPRVRKIALTSLTLLSASRA